MRKVLITAFCIFVGALQVRWCATILDILSNPQVYPRIPVRIDKLTLKLRGVNEEAAAAGLRTGDRMLAVGREMHSSVEYLRSIVRKGPGTGSRCKWSVRAAPSTLGTRLPRFAMSLSLSAMRCRISTQ